MRFPVRFTSDFQLGVAARILRTRGRQPLILKLAPFSSGASDRLPTVESAPSMIWIGGAEPLEYPEISRYSNALAASRREVFLQTDGKLFRRRVHEFQPSPRFRLVFGFTGAGVDAAENADVVEAIRIAKLSGFLTVGFTVLASSDGIENLSSLHAQLKKLDLDGALILAGDASPECECAVSVARSRLLDGRWSNLSRFFITAALSDPVERLEERSDQRAPQAARRHVSPPSSAADLEEGAQA